jgi:hypothetical protein
MYSCCTVGWPEFCGHHVMSPFTKPSFMIVHVTAIAQTHLAIINWIIVLPCVITFLIAVLSSELSLCILSLPVYSKYVFRLALNPFCV